MLIKKNVVSYGGGPQPGQLIVGNTADGQKTTLFSTSSTNGNYMFHSNTGLTSWTVDLPALAKGDSMFQNCTGLTSWEGDLPALSSATNMFQGCTKMRSATLNATSLKNASHMYNGASNLTEFFCSNLPILSNGSNMFYNCKLDGPSVLRLLAAIPTYEDGSTHQLNLGKRANFGSYDDVAALLGTTTPIAAGTYSYKGWTVTVMS